jgi:hypothetical protein
LQNLFLAAEQRAAVAHGATVGKIPENKSSPGTGRKKNDAAFLSPHPGLGIFWQANPRLSPWATFLTLLRS